VDMFALLAYNMSGMMVTDHLGAVFRCEQHSTAPQRAPQYNGGITCYLTLSDSAAVLVSWHIQPLPCQLASDDSHAAPCCVSQLA
jgi:hypothetical protein